MNRFVSNFILGFFVLMLMAVYGFAKQPTVYSMLTRNTTAGDSTQSETTGQVVARRVILPNGTTLNVQVATTEEERTRGLAGVEQLAENSGMLFVFPQTGTHGMWMKGMKMPLDMVWLDEKGKVVHLATEVQPPKDDRAELPVYQTDQPASYVLEMTAGEAEKAGIKEGVTLEIAG